MKPSPGFDHRYQGWTPPDEPGAAEECFCCGSPPDPLRSGLHKGEVAPEPSAEPMDLPLLEHLVRIVRAELADTQVSLTDTQLDILARRAAHALYLRGAVKTRRTDWDVA